MHVFSSILRSKYMFFINYSNILTLFYKFVIFSINLLLFDHSICYFLKYSAGNSGRNSRS